MIAGIAILFYSAVFFANIGTIFYFIDTVNNYEWNRWAIDFASNILPKHSSHFPQLLPANWSICYVMINKAGVQFFPKAIMPLFFIGNLLIFADLTFIKKNTMFLMGLIVYSLFAPVVYTLLFIADGNADLPVSFFSFMTFYSFITVTDIPKEGNFREYLLVFLFASMAAATKLAGSYIFIFISILLVLIIFIEKVKLNLRDITKIVLFVIAVSSLSLFWHLRAPEEIYSGLHQPQYLPKGYLATFIHAFKLMYYYLGLPIFVFFIFTITASLFKEQKDVSVLSAIRNDDLLNFKIGKNFKIPLGYITVIMVIIPIAIWMFKFSYDLRNLSFVIPFIALCSAGGVFKFLGYFSHQIQSESFVVANRDEPGEDSSSLSNKSKLRLFFAALTGCIFLILAISDKFYQFIYYTFVFINRYYFQSFRTGYFIESGFLLHVDFFQRVLIVFAIVIMGIPVLILLKFRMKIFLPVIITSLILLNFTYLKEENITAHQLLLQDRVEARNHYEWLKMIIESKGLDKEIITNFKAILKDNIKREMHFTFMENDDETSLKKISGNKLVFLKWSDLNVQAQNYIKNNIEKKRYEKLFNDYDFIFFVAR